MMKRKKSYRYLALVSIIAIVFTVAFTSTTVTCYATEEEVTRADSFTGGDGLSETTAFEISSPAELAYMAYLVNEKNSDTVPQSSIITYGTAYYRLISDINLNNETFTFHSETGLVCVSDGTNTAYIGTGIKATNSASQFYGTASQQGAFYVYEGEQYIAGDYSGNLHSWTSIGIQNHFFKGHFDGNSKKISGIYINNVTELASGLFGQAKPDETSGTVIKDLQIRNSLIIGKENVGGLVGTFGYLEHVSTPLPTTPIVTTPLPTTPVVTTPVPTTPVVTTPVPTTPVVTTPVPTTPVVTTPVPTTPVVPTPVVTTPVVPTPVVTTPVVTTPVVTTPVVTTPVVTTPVVTTPVVTTPVVTTPVVTTPVVTTPVPTTPVVTTPVVTTPVVTTPVVTTPVVTTPVVTTPVPTTPVVTTPVPTTPVVTTPVPTTPVVTTPVPTTPVPTTPIVSITHMRRMTPRGLINLDSLLWDIVPLNMINSENDSGTSNNANTLTIFNCSFDGVILGESNIGGLVGADARDSTMKEIANCYNKGLVLGSSTGVTAAGGIMGSAGTIPSTFIENCYNAGKVIANGKNCGAITGLSTAGLNYQRNCYYLEGSAIDGNGVVKGGVGANAAGSALADTNGETNAFTSAGNVVAPADITIAQDADALSNHVVHNNDTLLSALNGWKKTKPVETSYSSWMTLEEESEELPLFGSCYSVYLLLSNLTIESGSETTIVQKGEIYSTLLKTVSGYSLPDTITVTMSGRPLTDYVYSNGLVNIASGIIQGDITINANGVMISTPTVLKLVRVAV